LLVRIGADRKVRNAALHIEGETNLVASLYPTNAPVASPVPEPVTFTSPAFASAFAPR
jgi:hypothetical protein